MISLHPNARVNFALLIALGFWLLVLWPLILLYFATFLKAPAGIVETLVTYTGAMVGGPVVAALINFGKRKEKNEPGKPD